MECLHPVTGYFSCKRNKSNIWFTGDIVQRTENDTFHFVSRKGSAVRLNNEFINVEGYKKLLEEKLDIRHPVFLVASSVHRPEIEKLFLIIEGKGKSKDSIYDFVQTNKVMGHQINPLFFDIIPRNEIGKIDRFKILQYIRETV